MGSNPIPSMLITGCDKEFLTHYSASNSFSLILTAATTPINSSKATERASIEKLEKDIESIIAGSLPYHIPIFKKVCLVNPLNAETLNNFLLNKIKRM